MDSIYGHLTVKRLCPQLLEVGFRLFGIIIFFSRLFRLGRYKNSTLIIILNFSYVLFRKSLPGLQRKNNFTQSFKWTSWEFWEVRGKLVSGI